MKITSLIICLGAILLFSSSRVYALDSKENSSQVDESGAVIDTADMRYGKTPLNKLCRGVANILTFYLEVPASMFRVAEERGEILGCSLGMFQGLFTGLLRGIVGVYDTATFIIPSYNKPLMKPEYAIQSLEEAYRVYNDRID
ncbi:MAG: exosortase system-associated protein, TIGR04073 family [Candidatus Omnitrophota bacterium]